MGRRKIEIQPITHERNRSVTFLKRKSGLFKKAYELGVLCSVDVAVIIFEQRPGHNVKLYQYCSGDASEMVQRHIRFDGEKDTRGPADFSGSAATKLEDPAEGDDDDQEDEDEVITPLGSKRRSDGTKPAGDVGLGIDDYRRTQARTDSSSLPMSGERHSPSSKKQRIAPMLGPGRQSSSDMAGGGFSYAPSMRGASGSAPYNNSNPSSFYPLSAASQTPFGTSFEGYTGSRSQTHSRPYSEYNMPSSPSRRPSGTSGDPFGALMDADDASRVHNIQTQNPGYAGIDWPVHNNSSGGGGGTIRQPPPTRSPETTTGPANNNWLEYLGGAGERGGVSRGREGERPGSRGRVIEEYEVKKEA